MFCGSNFSYPHSKLFFLHQKAHFYMNSCCCFFPVKKSWINIWLLVSEIITDTCHPCTGRNGIKFMAFFVFYIFLFLLCLTFLKLRLIRGYYLVTVSWEVSLWISQNTNVSVNPSAETVNMGKQESI